MEHEHWQPPKSAAESETEWGVMPANVAVFGVARLKNFARQTPDMPHERYVPLFQTIAEDEKSTEAKKAVHDIAESYLGLALAEAERVWRRRTVVDLNFDDIVGSACEGLLHAINQFAATADYRAFAAFARKLISQAIDQEIACQRYGIPRDKTWYRSELYEYLHAKSTLEQEAGKPLTWREVAAATGQSSTKLRWLDMLRRHALSLRTLDRLETFVSTSRHHELAEAKTILVHRGLSLVSRDQAELLDKHYGLTGHAWSTSDLANERGGSGQHIRSKLYLARQTLAGVLTQLKNGSFDFVAWRLDHPTCRSALMLLGLTKQPIDPAATDTELRIAALRTLQASHTSERDQRIIAELYGLQDGRPKTGAEAAALTGVNVDIALRADREFLKRHGVIIQKKRSKNVQT